MDQRASRLSNFLVNALVVKSILFLILLIISSVVIVSYFVKPFMAGSGDYRLAADSMSYVIYADKVDDIGDTIRWGGNFLGPTLQLKLLHNNAYLIAFSNSLMLVLAFYALRKYYDFNTNKFIVLLLINPITIVSVASVSKEITGFAAVCFSLAFIKSKNKKHLLLALALSLLARWQHLAATSIFLFLIIHADTKAKRWSSVILGILLVSILYPILLRFAMESDSYLFDANRPSGGIYSGGGTIFVLNGLQDKYMYFIVFLPKLFLNLMGSLPSFRFDFTNLDEYGRIDIYNGIFLVVHQIATAIILLLSVVKRRIKISNDTIYYFCIYSIIFVSAPFVQFRYFYPVYCCLLLSYTMNTRTKPAHIASYCKLNRSYLIKR